MLSPTSIFFNELREKVDQKLKTTGSGPEAEIFNQQNL